MKLTKQQREMLERLPDAESGKAYMTNTPGETRVCNSLCRLGLAKERGLWHYCKAQEAGDEAS